MRTRVRRTKSGAANAPTRFELDATGQFDGLPYVLTVDAVKAGEMPELGSSGIPASLEAHVPAAMRYWKAADIETARSTRDALVDAGIFRAEDVAKVDGEHRLLVRRSFIAPTYEEKADGELVLEQRMSPVVHAASTLMLMADRPVVAMKASAADLVDLDDRVAWLVEMSAEDPETESAVLGKTASEGVRAFTLATRPDSVFVTNVPARKSAPHVVEYVAASSPEAGAAETAKRAVRLITKAEDVAAGEERFVLGIVLEPDVIDSQSDTYDAATIRAAAHGFMENYRNIGLQHQGYVTGKIEILESYLAPVDMEINGQAVKAGTWLMGLRFNDDALWEQVKAGALTGLSIGGTAIREPEPNAAALAPA